MNKILYITYDGLTDPLGQSQILPYIVGLSEYNYEFIIISLEKKDKYLEAKENVISLIQNKNIIWYPSVYSNKIPIISQYINILLLKNKALKLTQNNQFAIIHCRSYLPMIVGLKIKKKTGAKLLFDMRGFWVNERIEGKIWNIKNPVYYLIYKYFFYKEMQFFKKADFIVSLTQKAKIHLEKKFSKLPQIEVIPCCFDSFFFDINNIKPEQKLNLKKHLNINENEKILTYIGSLGTWYLSDKMLEFFSFLITKKPYFKFLILTNDDKSIVLNQAKKFNIPLDKLIVLSAKRYQIPLYLSITDLSIFFIKPSFSKIASSPTKFGEILAMGVPVISNKGIGDLDEQFNMENLGVLIDEFSLSKYNKIILSIDDLLKLNKENLIKFAHTHYSLQTGISMYRKIYEKLCLKY